MLIMNMFHSVPPVPKKSGTLEIEITNESIRMPTQSVIERGA
jgi:hypothetical protein